MKSDEAEHPVLASDRHIAIEGGSKLRDVGGYETVYGRRVRWNEIFRSGALSRLSTADWQWMSERDIGAICARAKNARSRRPNGRAATAPATSASPMERSSSAAADASSRPDQVETMDAGFASRR